MKKRQPLQMPVDNNGISGQMDGSTSNPMQISVNSNAQFIPVNAGSRHFISASMPTSMFATANASFNSSFGQANNFHQNISFVAGNQRQQLIPIVPNTAAANTINPSILTAQQQLLQQRASNDLLLQDALFPLSIEGMDVVDSLDPSPLDAQMMADDYLDFNSSNEDVVSSSMPDSIYSHQNTQIPHSPAASFGNSQNKLNFIPSTGGSSGGIFSVPSNAAMIQRSSAQSSQSAISKSPSIDLQSGSNDNVKNGNSEELEKQ